jgi:hypothetical protein
MTAIRRLRSNSRLRGDHPFVFVLIAQPSDLHTQYGESRWMTRHPAVEKRFLLSQG